MTLINIPRICPICNADILIEINDSFHCQNHFNSEKCYGFAGNKNYTRLGVSDNITIVFNFDKNNAEIWVNNIQYIIINEIIIDKYDDINLKYCHDILRKYFWVNKNPHRLKELEVYLTENNLITN